MYCHPHNYSKKSSKRKQKKKKKSFRKMFNSRGPNTEPCGNHVVILSHSLKVLFTLTLCLLFVKWLFIYLRVSLSNPYAINLAINKSWFNVLKAFETSMKITLIYILLYLRLSCTFPTYNLSSVMCYDFLKILLIVLIVCLSCNHLCDDT